MPSQDHRQLGATNGIKLVGVDLAWKSEKHSSAIAHGILEGRVLRATTIEPAVYGVDKVFKSLTSRRPADGIAIDAPLIIRNPSGQRRCEKEIGQEYGSRHASCHTSNTELYPDARSVSLSKRLLNCGYNHLEGKKWQFECYPHPSLIEIFGLPNRLKYKKGRIAEKLAGQKNLASLLLSLQCTKLLPMSIHNGLRPYLDHARIDFLKGTALKTNEDALDSLVCLYIAGLRAIGHPGHVFGDTESGYIWVPNSLCV